MKPIKSITKRLICFLIIGSLTLTPLSVRAETILKNQDFFDAVHEYVTDNYALEVTDEQLYDHAIKGMFEALDPYSSYLTADEYRKMMEEDSGSYAGIGAVLGKDKAGYYIVEVMSGSPAEIAGLKAGDRIKAVGQTLLTGSQSLEEVVAIVKGPENTTISLTILRGGIEKKYSLTRKNITIASVQSRVLKQGIGYLRISQFIETTGAETEAAITALRAKGVTKVVLDLRGNPGGLLSTCLVVTDYFTPKGKVLELRYAKSPAEQFDSAGKSAFTKVAVLIDQNTASAAEILAGAIQDRKSGTLIGTKTFGKGIVQDIYPLKNGEAIKLTVAKYYLPSGRYIHGKGISPDIAMNPSTDPSDDNLLERAEQLLGQ